MAPKSGTVKGRMGAASIVCAALTVLFLMAGCAMLALLVFGHNYKQEALDASQRVEFDVSYDETGNAIPGNLIGEPLDMETAQAMATLAISAQEQAQEQVESAARQEEAEAEKPEEASHAPAEMPATEGILTPAPTKPEAIAFPQEQAPVSPTVAESQPAATPTENITETKPAETAQGEAETSSAEETASTAITPSALAPVEEKTDEGVIPVIGANGVKPWQFFAKKDFTAAASKPRIAVIVTGLGLSTLSTDTAIAMLPEVTLAFSPYGRERTAALASKARSAGHEILLDLPMQTDRYPAVDPGPYGIRADLSPEDNAARLRTALTKMRGYVGLVGTARDVIAEDKGKIVPLIQAIAGHGLLFVSGHNQPPEGMFRIARTASVPVLMTDIVADERMSDTLIKNQLARAEDRARTHGYALVLGHAYPLTIDLLAEWVKTLDKKGFALVPVSALGEANG